MRLLESLAKLCAILAGVLLTIVTLMTCGSLIGRNLLGVTIVGDFELSGAAAGAAVALFMPWCQYQRGNIIVDFFTARATAGTTELLDRFGAFLLGLAMALLAWRTSIGGVNAWKSGIGNDADRLSRVADLCGDAAAARSDRRHRDSRSRSEASHRPRRIMSPLAITGAIFAVMLLLMALRTPIAIAMFVAGAIGYVAQAGWAPFANFLNAQAFARFASYDLSVIPLFILMGNFASQGGISRSLFEFASSVMARFRGGLAMAAVLASGAFGAICGSSVATAATITSVALPEMRRHGYSGRLATGTLAAGGTLGILIPPSVPLVIYAILAEQNIAKLFAAAMVPGIIACSATSIAIAIYVRVVPGQAPGSTTDRAGSTLRSLARLVPIAIIFLSSSAASTAESLLRPKARRSAPPRPSSPRSPSARSPGRS